VRLTRLIILLMTAAAAVWTGDARGAVSADAVPDAASPFTVSFTALPGPTVQTVTVNRLRAGERVTLSCENCLGQTSVSAVATGAQHVFRPKLRLNGNSRLAITVLGRNFGRTREYRVQGGRLHLDLRRCTSLAEDRPVGCRALRAQRPWATINVCTSSAVGVRAASPGGGSRRYSVAARFRLQYADGSQWVDVPQGTSPWTVLGRSHRSWQGGYTFRFGDVRGRTFRGLVEFEWRRGTRVVRRAARFASPGRVSGVSSSVCAPT
jgi:hypothetical protein